MPNLKVTRRWKRDGSENEMSLEDASINLAAHCLDMKMKVKGAKKLQEYLEAGVIFETEHAEFFLRDVIIPNTSEDVSRWLI